MSTAHDARRAFEAGDDARALALALEAARRGDDPEALVVAVNAATRLRDWETAVAVLERLVARAPEDPRFPRLLSTALNNAATRGAQQAATTIARYERAIETWPDNVEALSNLARALRHDDPPRAATLAARAAELRPGDAGLARGAVTAMLGAATYAAESGDVAMARAAHAHAAAIGRDGAIAPSLRGVLGARLALPAVHDDGASIARSRAAFANGLDALDAMLDEPALARCERALAQLQWSNFLLAYHGEDDRELQSRYGDLAARLAARLAPDFESPAPRPRGRRVAFVSGFLRETTVGSYFGAWVGALARAGFEVTSFALGPHHDETTAAIEADATVAVRLDGSLDDAARTIRDAAPDLVLYPELGMDARCYALAALRLASVQACAWGHPVTSGLPTIDAYFTCGAMEPADGASHYRERLLALPGLGTAYRAPPAFEARGRAALGLPDGTLYLVPQSAFKIHPEHDAVMLEVLRLDPHARIVLFENERAGATARLTARLGRACAEAGLDAARFVFVPLRPRAEYLAVNAACDVMLDTVRWSGGNTTLDALHAGLPVVTCPGRYMRGRQSAAMLELLGLERELVVGTREALACRAVEVARDGSRRLALSHAIVDRRAALLDGSAPLESLVAHVEQLLAT